MILAKQFSKFQVDISRHKKEAYPGERGGRERNLYLTWADRKVGEDMVLYMVGHRDKNSR